MATFEYTHKDGRKGQGASPWYAVIAALGKKDAFDLGPVQDLKWTVTSPGEAPLVDATGGRLGVVREVRR